MMRGGNADSFIWWDWVWDHTSEIRSAVVEHLIQTVIAVGVGFVVAILVSALARRVPALARPIASAAAMVYTIPSLALFAVLIPITHLTLLTAEIALVLYTQITLVPNLLEGMAAVPRSTRDAADGMGLTPVQRFLSVELPLAAPSVIAGLRVTTVATVGLVTISSYVGLGGGFGTFITDGRQRAFSTPLVVGILGSVALAVVLDLAFVLLLRWVTRWQRNG
jgi:osmoprotectant transport system permease protein